MGNYKALFFYVIEVTAKIQARPQDKVTDLEPLNYASITFAVSSAGNQ